MNRIGQIAIFLSVLVALTGTIHGYLWLRLVADTGFSPQARRFALVGILLLALGMPLALLLQRIFPLALARWLVLPFYLWMGMMLWLLAFLLTSDALKWGVWVVARLGQAGGLAEWVRGQTWARWAALLSTVGSLGLSAIGLPRALARPRVQRLEVCLERLPAALDGFTIAQLTDLHLGPSLLGKGWVERVVAQTNALRPDLVAITGDLVDGSVEELTPLVLPLMALQATHGVFFVTGNHEFYVDPVSWVAALPRFGIRVLNNERVVVERGGAGFDLAGVHDLEGNRIYPPFRPDLKKALQGRDPTRELILLAHQPKVIAEAERAGVGLMLSGHTHGGQIWPFGYLVYLQQPVLRGDIRFGGTRLYVSEGTGFWGPPLRLGSTSEITLVTLRSPRAAGSSPCHP